MTLRANMSALLRKLRIGQAWYFLYHRPKSVLQQSMSEGGPLEQWRTAQGRDAMIEAARVMPELARELVCRAPVTVHFLTGTRFWYQAVFCIWTFAKCSGRPVHGVILDDGTLQGNQFEAISRVCTSATLIANREIEERLDQHLPATKFPSLRGRRLTLPLMRKILDVHAGQKGWRLSLDSDLLFFRRPTMLLDWLADPSCPIRAIDVQNAYGYPLEIMSGLAGHPVPERVNTGILGLKSDAIDWERMESWCRGLIEARGPHYFQEQALVAMLLAGREHFVAPLADYVTLPRPPEARACRAVMHHYVAESKRWYFQSNWRRVLEPGNSSEPSP